MTHRYKKHNKKTRKKYIGGSIQEPRKDLPAPTLTIDSKVLENVMDPKVLENIMDPKVLENLIDKSKENVMNIIDNTKENIMYLIELTTPFGILKFVVKTIFQEFKKCVEMLNNILLEQGLFIRNVINVGFETSIYYIIGDVCEDLFLESTCKTKINFLDNKQIEPQKGGGGSSKYSPDTEEEIKKNLFILNQNIISENPNRYNNKEDINIELDKELHLLNKEKLYSFLKCLKVLHSLYKEKYDKEPKIKLPSQNDNPNMCLDFWSNKIQLNKEDEKHCETTGKPLFVSKNYSSNETWKKCSDLHLGKNEITDELNKLCKLDCDNCIMKENYIFFGNSTNEQNISLYLKSIKDVMKNYYDIEDTYIDDTLYVPFKEPMNKKIEDMSEDEQFETFKIDDVEEKKKMPEEISNIFYKIYKINKNYFIQYIISKILIDKLNK